MGMKSRILGQRGVSIVGTIFTLILLGVLGAALIALVATEQESRTRAIKRERAFYAVQAGFEYALREIKEGGYPIVSNKALGDATITTAIDPSQRRISVVGADSEVSKSYSITTDKLASDCAEIDDSSVSASGDELHGLVIKKNCLDALNIASMSFTWSPDLSEAIRKIIIAGTQVYYDVDGASSGDNINISDTKIIGNTSVDSVQFSSGVSGKDMTLTLYFTDSSSISKSFSVP